MTFDPKDFGREIDDLLSALCKHEDRNHPVVEAQKRRLVDLYGQRYHIGLRAALEGK
jgi:hypothetical protein